MISDGKNIGDFHLEMAKMNGRALMNDADDVVRRRKKFPRRVVVTMRRLRIMGVLARSSHFGSDKLTVKLAACSRLKRCWSSACAHCEYEMRKGFICAADDAFARDTPLTRVTLLPRNSRVPLGGLSEFDLNRLVNSCRRALRRLLPDVVVLGLVNLSPRLLNGEVIDWQIKLELFVEATNTSELRAAIGMCCPVESAAVAPLHFRQIQRKSLSGMLDQVVKSLVFVHFKHFQITGQQKSSHQTSKSEAAVELALLLNRHPLRRRLIAHGLLIRGHYRLGFYRPWRNPTPPLDAPEVEDDRGRASSKLF